MATTLRAVKPQLQLQALAKQLTVETLVQATKCICYRT
jgi:hypothetical protein